MLLQADANKSDVMTTTVLRCECEFEKDNKTVAYVNINKCGVMLTEVVR